VIHSLQNALQLKLRYAETSVYFKCVKFPTHLKLPDLITLRAPDEENLSNPSLKLTSI